MMDPSRVIPKGFHFAKTHTHNGVNQSFSWRERWDVRPVSYFIIDFGISSIWPSKNDAVVKGKCGQDQSAPEFLHARPFNLFKLDIYHLGNVIKGLIKACFHVLMSIDVPDLTPKSWVRTIKASRYSKTLHDQWLLSTLMKDQLRPKPWLCFSTHHHTLICRTANAEYGETMVCIG